MREPGTGRFFIRVSLLVSAEDLGFIFKYAVAPTPQWFWYKNVGALM